MTPRRGPYGVPGAKSPDWFKRQRLRLRLTQEELADALGLQQSGIAKRENGTARITPADVAAVQKLLDRQK